MTIRPPFFFSKC